VLSSQLCTLESLKSPALRPWAERLRAVWNPEGTDLREVIIHRKLWEWLYICEALAERDMLRSGRTGVGFGVGKEPLVAVFASAGCQILATDLHRDRAEATGWRHLGLEYADGLDGLNEAGLCDPEVFGQLVTYRDVDMNVIPSDLGEFDFSWSSCALEHLGSLQAGADFIVNQMAFVTAGGVGVHTTEFNTSSDSETISTGGTVLYRRPDLLEIAERLNDDGYRIKLDLREGDSLADQHVDVPPFTDTHLRTMLGEFVTTSVALVIEKPMDWAPRKRWRSNFFRRTR